MRNRRYIESLAFLLSLLQASPVFSPLYAAERAAALGRVVSAPPATLNGAVLPGEATLWNGDRLATGADGWARVLLARGDQIHLGAQGEAWAKQQGDALALELAKGRVSLRTGANSAVTVRSNGLEILPKSPEQAVWEVAWLREGVTLVAAQQGTVEVRAANRVMQVLAGQSLRVESRLADDDRKPAGAGAGAGMSSGMKLAVTLLVVFGLAAAIAIPVALSANQQPVSPSGL